MKIIEVLQEKMKMSHIEIEERTKILEEINPLKKGKKKYFKFLELNGGESTANCNL